MRAVDGVSLAIHQGETVGLVGESGCGKSTTSRLILRLLDADAGAVRFDGTDLMTLRGRRLRELRRRLQLVPQNPQTSFNPKKTIGDSIAFNLTVHGSLWVIAEGVNAGRSSVASANNLVNQLIGSGARYPFKENGFEKWAARAGLLA